MRVYIYKLTCATAVLQCGWAVHVCLSSSSSSFFSVLKEPTGQSHSVVLIKQTDQLKLLQQSVIHTQTPLKNNDFFHQFPHFFCDVVKLWSDRGKNLSLKCIFLQIIAANWFNPIYQEKKVSAIWFFASMKKISMDLFSSFQFSFNFFYFQTEIPVCLKKTKKKPSC